MDKNISIQHMLSQSYTAYLFGFLLGFILDLFFVNYHFNSTIASFVGLLILFIATIFIFWTQKSNKPPKDAVIGGRRDFYKGPYKWSRHPTHAALFLLLLGSGMLVGSYIIIAVSIIVYVLARMTFIKKEEDALVTKYGEIYLEYRKKVQPFV